MIERVQTFISYAREDWDTAKKLYDDLRQRGIQVWIDKEDLLPGQNWKTTIPQIIRSSCYVLLLLSSHSISKRGFVQKEVKIALEAFDEFPSEEIFIIPIRLDDRCFPKEERLRDLHWVNLFESYDEGIKKILRVITSKQSTIQLSNNNISNLESIDRNPQKDREQEQSFQQSPLIPYEIIKREEKDNIKIAFDVRVDRIDHRVPIKEELAAISNHLYYQEKSHERTFVFFYLPGMEPGYGAFATAHHNPKLEVQILHYPLPYDKATKFHTIQEMIEEFNDYNEEDGTFKVLDNAPLHIQLSPTVFSNESTENIIEELKRTIIYGIFRTFIHTNYSTIIVAATPLEIHIPDKNINKMTKKYLEKASMTVSSTRDKVEACTRKLLKIRLLEELVETQIISHVPSRDRWTSTFEKWLYNDDEKYPRLNILFETLSR